MSLLHLLNKERQGPTSYWSEWHSDPNRFRRGLACINSCFHLQYLVISLSTCQRLSLTFLLPKTQYSFFWSCTKKDHIGKWNFGLWGRGYKYQAGLRRGEKFILWSSLHFNMGDLCAAISMQKLKWTNSQILFNTTSMTFSIIFRRYFRSQSWNFRKCTS